MDAAPASGRVRVAQPLDKAVHIPVKADLLAVEIAGIVEKAAVQNVERQEEQRRRQGAQPHCQPEAVTLTPRQAETARSERIHGKGLLSLRERDLPVIICIRSSPLLVKHGLDEGVDVFQMAQLTAVPPQGLKGASALRRYCCELSHLEDIDTLIEAVFDQQRRAADADDNREIPFP